MYDPEQIELPASVQETFLGKPPVQANYSAHWMFDTMSEADSRKLIAVYWGYVTLIDEQIGRVLAEMDALGLSDSTAVMFSSDHGEFTGAHRLHDKGPAMYEDIYRTCGIVRVPGAPAGQVRDEFVSLLDTTATVLDWCGLDPSPAVDSRSLLPLVRGEAVDWDDAIVCEFHGHHFPYPQRMLRTGRYKLVVNPESVNELYDLELDPDELHNRYRHPEMRQVRERLSADLYRRLRERGDNFYHWMTSMDDIGQVDYDPSMSGLDEGTHRAAGGEASWARGGAGGSGPRSASIAPRAAPCVVRVRNVPRRGYGPAHGAVPAALTRLPRDRFRDRESFSCLRMRGRSRQGARRGRDRHGDLVDRTAGRARRLRSPTRRDPRHHARIGP